MLYICWYSTKPSHDQCNSMVSHPIIPRHMAIATVFPIAGYEIVMQRLLEIYHGISLLSLLFSWHTHSPKGPCVYKGNTADSWDIPQYITWKHCITSIYTLSKGGTYPRMPCYLPSKCLWILFIARKTPISFHDSGTLWYNIISSCIPGSKHQIGIVPVTKMHTSHIQSRTFDFFP